MLASFKLSRVSSCNCWIKFIFCNALVPEETRIKGYLGTLRKQAWSTQKSLSESRLFIVKSFNVSPLSLCCTCNRFHQRNMYKKFVWFYNKPVWTTAGASWGWASSILPASSFISTITTSSAATATFTSRPNIGKANKRHHEQSGITI